MQTSRIAVAPPERLELKGRAASRSGRSDDAKRAKLILKLAAGHSYSQIMKSLECSQNYIVRWKRRFLEERIGGLYARHQGRSPAKDAAKMEARILDHTRRGPSDGSTHWSTRKLCVDEKTAIQALDRLDPVLPFSPGRAERHGFEYHRHGTLSLYAALETRTGEIVGQTAVRHTSAEFVAFLAQIVAHQPAGRAIHIIADNLSAHKTKGVAEFLQSHPLVKLHYTPTYSSWLNQVEFWFSKIA